MADVLSSEIAAPSLRLCARHRCGSARAIAAQVGMVAEERPPPAEEPPAEEPPQEEDDVVDPKEKLERLCRASAPCAGLLARYEECAARVRSRPGTSETCTEEFLDLAPCIDDCVAKHLFKFLA